MALQFVEPKVVGLSVNIDTDASGNIKMDGGADYTLNSAVKKYNVGVKELNIMWKFKLLWL